MAKFFISITKSLCRAALICGVMLAASTTMAGVKSVGLQGILGNKAVLLIDGKRHVIGIGDTTEEGVTLVAIENDTAILDVNGQRRKQTLGENIALTTRYAEPQSQEVLVSQNTQGLFSTVGSINGLTVNMLVDTGANIVTLNAQHAKRLGIAYEQTGEPVMVATASGVVKAYRVNLRSVTVGEIELRDVAAVVMMGPHPVEILLGMTFLGNLEIQRNGNVMKIRKNF